MLFVQEVKKYRSLPKLMYEYSHKNWYNKRNVVYKECN